MAPLNGTSEAVFASAMQLKVGVVILGVEDRMLDAFPVDLVYPFVIPGDKVALDDGKKTTEPETEVEDELAAVLGSGLKLELEDGTEAALRPVVELEVDDDDTKFALDTEVLELAKSPGKDVPDIIKLLPAVKDVCEDAWVDGPNVGPDRVEKEDARYLAELRTLKDDGEYTEVEGLDAWLKTFDEE